MANVEAQCTCGDEWGLPSIGVMYLMLAGHRDFVVIHGGDITRHEIRVETGNTEKVIRFDADGKLIKQ